MGRRCAPKAAMDVTQQRAAMLRGIRDEAAVYLYDEAMRTLQSRGQADFFAALQLRDACLWTEAITDMQRELQDAIRNPQADARHIAAIIRNQRTAQDSRRRVLSALMLIPQKPRGRPRKDGDETEDDDTDDMDDGWADFGAADPPRKGADDP